MEQKSKAIGTTVYLVTQMDAISALKIQTKLMKLVGPGLLSLDVDSLNDDKNKPIKDRLIGKLEKVIPALIQNFDDDLVNEVVLSLFKKGVFIEEAIPGAKSIPKVVDFAEHFRGKTIEMWKVVAFILEVNFSMGELLGSILPTTSKAKLTQENII